MKRLKELQQEIEDARRKLDYVIGTEADEDLCYQCSVELDQLIEEYITMEECSALPVI